MLKMHGAEAAIHSTRAAVHAAYMRLGAALRCHDARAAAAASVDARKALHQHASAVSAWLDAVRP